MGFGGLILFLIAAATGTLVSSDRARNEETRLRKAFLARLGGLDQIRAQIYLSGTYVRDFLLSPDEPGAASQSTRLSGLERETQAALLAYSQSLAPEERQPFATLRSEIEAYWAILDRMLAWSPEERNRLRNGFFYDELVPRRTTMLQIADRIAAVNERGLSRVEEELAQSSEGLRRSLLMTFGVTLVRRPGAGVADHRLHRAPGARAGAAPGRECPCQGRFAGTLQPPAARPGE